MAEVTCPISEREGRALPLFSVWETEEQSVGMPVAPAPEGSPTRAR